MDIAEVAPAASNQTPVASDQNAADREAWRLFIRNPGIVPWIEGVICGRLGYRPSPEVLAWRLNNAWCELAKNGTYRSGKGGLLVYASEVVRGSMRRTRWKGRVPEDSRPRAGQKEAVEDLVGVIEASAQRSQREDEIRQIQELVQELSSQLAAELRQWAEAYCWEVQAPPDGERQRHDPLRATQRRLGWTRSRCDRVRLLLQQAFHRQGQGVPVRRGA